MRILQIVSLLTPDGAFGGPATVAVNQCVELARRGHQVTLAAGRRHTPAPAGDGVRLESFSARTLLPGTGFPGMVVPGLARWVLSHAGEFDVAHVHFGRDLMVLPVTAILHRTRLPYVLQTHGMVIPSRHPLAGPLDALGTRRLLSDAAAVLYLTELERSQLRAVAQRELRFSQLENGVPEYPPANGGSGIPEVLFVARLDARKRPGLFVLMAKLLLSEGIDARFTLIGPDEGEGGAVRRLIGDEPRIRWEGPVEPSAVPHRMAQAAVYVLPSEAEPYPMAVLEAMAVGLPVVVCDDCGLAPVIVRTGSGVVTPGTVDGLASAVRLSLTGRTEFGTKARETARHEFGMNAIGERLVSVYERAQGL